MMNVLFVRGRKQWEQELLQGLSPLHLLFDPQSLYEQQVSYDASPRFAPVLYFVLFLYVYGVHIYDYLKRLKLFRPVSYSIFSYLELFLTVKEFMKFWNSLQKSSPTIAFLNANLFYINILF